MNEFGEPNMGNPSVRFDEGRESVGHWPLAFQPILSRLLYSAPQPPKSAIESHLRFAESFRVHGPTSTSESAAVSTPPPRNNSLRYTRVSSF
jgi:hypothetical protein